MMQVFINRVHFPVTTLGWGRRVGVWFQGCSIRCPGCVSRDTWEAGTGGIAMAALADAFAPWLAEADGLTVSGGEPFDQPDALAALVDWWRKHHAGDVLVFSGYSSEYLAEEHAALVARLDVLVTDPFETRAAQSLPLRGSDNQRLHCLTPLAQTRYSQLQAHAALDVCWDGDQVWLAGIPRSADMARLRRELAALGFSANTSDQIPLPVRA